MHLCLIMIINLIKQIIVTQSSKWCVLIPVNVNVFYRLIQKKNLRIQETQSHEKLKES